MFALVLLLSSLAVVRQASTSADVHASKALNRISRNYFGHHDPTLLNKLFVTSEGGLRRVKSPMPSASLVPAPYAEWAHYHWVWLSNDRATQDSMTKYATEYLNHSIKVGAIDIDSKWETGFNNFKPNTKYPNATAMVDWCHSKGINVIFWITSMVDTDSDNYKYGAEHEYYIKDVLGKPALMKWWHGQGSLLDYTNPSAVEWWHQQMDQVLAMGVDGWKCDGTDPYILEVIDARGKHGHVTYRDYADGYYGDFLDHTRKVRGQRGLIMSRPVDSFGPLYLKFSPPRVMFSGWVGDADPTFSGLMDTLKRYLQSAWSGYTNFGCDIGGYRSGNGTLGRTKELFIRWAQLGTFSPLMENGGCKEHRPWEFDKASATTPTIEEIYKGLVETHYQLVPYLLTTGTLAYSRNKSSLLPLAPHQDFIEKAVDLFDPPTFNYFLGADILVAPITSDPAHVNVTFPHVKGNDSYVAWWNQSRVYSAGQTVTFENLGLDVFTAFHRTGGLLPLRPASNSFESFSNVVDKDWIQFHLYFPESIQPDPVQVIDDSSGLVAAYWLEPMQSTDLEQQDRDSHTSLHFVTSAHRSLKVSLHVYFGGDDKLSPCHRPLRVCAGDSEDQLVSTSCSRVPEVVDKRQRSNFVGGEDPSWTAQAEGESYFRCSNGEGELVVKHGRVTDGLFRTVLSG